MTAQVPGQAARFRKRPAEVEAARWTGGNLDEVYELAGCARFDVLDEQDRANCDDPDATAAVFDDLHSTWQLVKTGQWIVKRGDKGLLFVYDDDLFHELYEDAAQERPAPGTPSLEEVIAAEGPDSPIGGLLRHVMGTCDEHRPAPVSASQVRRHEAQAAPELAAAMREARGYREALEQVRAIILEGDNSTEGSRLRRSRAVIRAVLEGR